MGLPNAEFLFVRLLSNIGFLAKSVTQNAVYQRTISAAGQLDRFINRGVFRNLEQKQLVKAEPQQIARSMVEMSRAESADPEIEQSEIPQNTVDQFSGKCAIGRRQLAGS